MELNLKVQGYNLIVIGTNHKEEYYKLIEKTLVPFAVKKEIGLFLEGIKRDNSAELSALKNLYDLDIDDKGYFFGIEDEFVNAFCGIVLHYLYLINNLESEFVTSKAQTVYDILANNTVNSYWQGCKNSCALAEEIENYLENNKEKDLKFLINNLNQLKHYDNIKEWINLFNCFINLMLKDAIKRGVDKNLMKNLLKNPKNKNYHTEFVMKINGFWRDTHIVKNIKKTLYSNVIPKSLKVYLLIGEAHLPNLEKLFKKGGGQIIGANVNLRDNNGRTALYHAIEPCDPKNQKDVENRTEIVKLLLEAEADPNIPDNNGITPLMIAEEKGLVEIANLLKKYGAK